MNIADRIQTLRKGKGISQEELANKVGVSRQAVSKWESEQSIPDLDKIITMSEYFNVTTDYILKGTQNAESTSKVNNELTSKILYIASTTFIVIGLLCSFGGWYEEQTMESIWGSMIIQAVGVAGYFIGRLLSSSKPCFLINWLNLITIIFIPISMLSGIISILFFKQGSVAPYPIGIWHFTLFAVIYLSFSAISFIVLKKINYKVN